MPIIAVDTLRVSNLVKFETKPELGYCRTVVTVNEASATNYVVGTVLGKVTASGKYKVAVETAVDGSKVAAGIVLAATAIAASTDTSIVILTKGPASVSKSALALDATYNDGTKQGVVYAAFEAAGIQVLNAA